MKITQKPISQRLEIVDHVLAIKNGCVVRIPGSYFLRGDVYIDPSQADKYYEHDQGTPSLIWVCEHNFNKIPSVTIIDSAGTEVEGFVEHDANFLKTTLTFSAPFSGKAYFN